MENSLGVGDPQTVFLSGVSSVKTPIGEEWIFGFLRIHAPQKALSNVRYCRTWSDNGSRALLLQHPAKTADVL